MLLLIGAAAHVIDILRRAPIASNEDAAEPRRMPAVCLGWLPNTSANNLCHEPPITPK